MSIKDMSQEELADIAKNDPDPEIRRSAIKKLTDQKALADIAETDIEWEVRYEAVLRLNDKAALTEIAINDTNDIVREAAFIRHCAVRAASGSHPYDRFSAANCINVRSLTNLIDEEPEKYCNKEIIYSLSKRYINWMCDLSRHSLETVLKYLLGLESCNIYGKDNLHDYFVDNDDAIIKSVIAAYRKGSYADLIKDYGGIAVVRHRDHSCYGIQIYDEYLPAEYLRDML